MKKSILFLSLITITAGTMAQKAVTTSAVVTFDATTSKDPLPKAENKAVIASLDKQTGVLLFEAAVNNFAFTNAKMQEHFNGDKWMNSVAFPKFTFTGKINKHGVVKYKKNGSYKVTVSGNMTVKGISKQVNAPATIIVNNGVVTSTSTFKIKLTDYGITGSSIDSGKVATEPTITVSAQF